VTCRQTVSLGAYLLGALDPAERSAFEEHLATCKTCKAELLRLAPLPGLLQRLTPEDYAELEAGDPPDFPPVDLFPLMTGFDPATEPFPAAGHDRPGDPAGATPPPVIGDPPATDGVPDWLNSGGQVLPATEFRPVAELPPVVGTPPGTGDLDGEVVPGADDVQSSGADAGDGPALTVVPTTPGGKPGKSGKPGWWRRQGTAVAAAAAIVLLALGGLFVFQPEGIGTDTTATAVTPVTWTAVDPSTGVRGRVELISRGWGTEVKVSMQDVPAGRKICHLYVYSRDGSREVAGKWTAGYYREVRSIPGSSSFKLGDIDRIEVVAAGGVLVGMHSP
jgi:Putative zinc-finger